MANKVVNGLLVNFDSLLVKFPMGFETSVCRRMGYDAIIVVFLVG